jgi:ring-1,2-phenylacetyl-CoA epoxidase subunit PaaE
MTGLLTPAATTTRRSTFHPLTVVGVERLTDEATAITFAIPGELTESYRFLPGQHLTLRRQVDGAEVRNSYSICQSAQAGGGATLRVAAAKVPGGRMSPWLVDELAVGDVVDVMTPLGTFTCPARPDEARHHLAIAAGSGITPVLSLVTTALEQEPGSRVTLLFGNRRTATVMFLEELEDLKNRYDGVDEVYLCGPFGMVQDAQAELEARGFDAHHVHHEIFHVDDGSPKAAPVVVDTSAPPAAVVTVSLDGRTTVIPMPTREETILDATLRARPDAPYSCTGGVCGTCRARVVSGEVRMDRNYALEKDEVAAGIVLACQAHPVSDTVELDYDA